MKQQKYYTYICSTYCKTFETLDEMRHFATNVTHTGHYYIGTGTRTYHRTREQMLNTFDDTLDN